MTKLLILLLIPALSFAQNKGDNTIISKDTTATLAKFRSAFMDAGYVIDKDNETYLTTELLSKSWYGIKFVASKVSDSVILKAYIRSDLTLMGVRNDNLILADFKGSKGTATKIAFEKLYSLVGGVSKEFYSKKQ